MKYIYTDLEVSDCCRCLLAVASASFMPLGGL